MITITDIAIEEIKKQAVSRKSDPTIRIAVRGGGCTGFSYHISWLDSLATESDKVFEKEGVSIVVDPKSFVYLDGTEVDFVTTFMGHGFKLNNPQQKGACGCGESVLF